MRLWTLIVASVALLSAPAAADVVALDTVSVDLALPEGFCKLDRTNAHDKLFYDQQDTIQAGKNIVVQIAIPCSDRAAYEKTKITSQWAIWLQTGAKPYIISADVSRADIVKQLAAEIPKLDTAGLAEDTASRTKKVGTDVKLSNFGLIETTPDAAYSGLIADASNATMKRRVAGVFAMTMLSGRLFSFNLYRDFESRKSLDLLLDQVKDVTKRTISATDAIKIDRSLPGGMTPPKAK